MGLDMHLYRRCYVRGAKITLEAGDYSDARLVKPDRIAFVTEEVAYWRKANHVHRWFVEHVQGGKDECQESRVSVEQLRALLEVCQALLADRSEMAARRLLPTQGGFFFGDTGYGDCYWQDVAETVKQLEPLLAQADEDEFEFFYMSSW